MKTACIIGHFGFGHNLLNGQTVKTKILAEALEAQFPDGVTKIDTHGGVKSLIKAPFHVIAALRGCRNVVILPAHNGLRVYAPLLALLAPLFKGRRLHYAVIGGWLPDYLKSHGVVAKALRKFHGIYVETNTMKRALEEQGYANILVMPNCKELPVLSLDELIYPAAEPYKLCTFSRVMKEKGIEDAVEAVKAVNERLGKTVYTLDIYGQVDAVQVEWFEELQKSFPACIRYGGLVPFDQSVEVLKDYFALLFPTRFFTEGIPGTIIDAYAAGIPVVSAKWESYADVINDGVTGICYDFDNEKQFEDILLRAAEDPSILSDLKPNCIRKANDYLPETAIRVITERLG